MLRTIPPIPLSTITQVKDNDIISLTMNSAAAYSTAKTANVVYSTQAKDWIVTTGAKPPTYYAWITLSGSGSVSYSTSSMYPISASGNLTLSAISLGHTTASQNFPISSSYYMVPSQYAGGGSNYTRTGSWSATYSIIYGGQADGTTIPTPTFSGATISSTSVSSSKTVSCSIKIGTRTYTSCIIQVAIECVYAAFVQGAFSFS